MRVSVLVWALRAAATFDVLLLFATAVRALRAHRAAQFKPRPSTAQGLAGRYTPSVSVVVPAADGKVGTWLSALSYPRWELIVAVPDGVAVTGRLPDGAMTVTAPPARGSLLAAATSRAAGEVVVILPSDLGVGPGFLKRIVTPLVDPFVGAAVGKVLSTRSRPTLAGRMDDVDRSTRVVLQVGRHVIGAPVTSEREPVAVRRLQIADVGGWDETQGEAETDLLLRLYVRGFAVAYVEDAVALTPSASWAEVHERSVARTAGLRRIARAVRRPVRRTRVLEGPEKTDVRWLTRGAAAPVWLLAGWVLTAVLRLADTSWAPELIGGALVLATFATIRGAPFITVSAAAIQGGRRTLLAFEPWLPLLSLGWVWSGTVGVLTAPFRRRGPRSAPEPAQARPAPRGRRRPADTPSVVMITPSDREQELTPTRSERPGRTQARRARPAPRARPAAPRGERLIGRIREPEGPRPDPDVPAEPAGDQEPRDDVTETAGASPEPVVEPARSDEPQHGPMQPRPPRRPGPPREPGPWESR